MSETIDPTEHKAPLIEHLRELKKRLIYCVVILIISFAISYYYAETIYAFLLKPLAYAEGGAPHKLIYTGLTEAFFTYIKLAGFTSFLISFPMIASQFYLFLSPGLYQQEKKVLFPYLIATPILFILGAALVYYLIFPAAWKFFLGFESNGTNGALPIQLEARVSEYLSLVMHLIIAFGVAFQLPVILTLLVRIGFITTDHLVKKRRIAIVIIFIVAAILTPPDIISMLGLAVPMLLLYECSIVVCRRIEKGRLSLE